MTTNRELAAILATIMSGSEPLPVPLQALIAGTLLSANGEPVSKAGMARIGKYSHGSAHKHYNELLVTLQHRIPLEISRMNDDDRDPITITQLRAELTERDATIDGLREQLSTASENIENVRRYALALHQQVHDLEAQAASTEGRQVRPLRIFE